MDTFLDLICPMLKPEQGLTPTLVRSLTGRVLR